MLIIPYIILIITIFCIPEAENNCNKRIFLILIISASLKINILNKFKYENPQQISSWIRDVYWTQVNLMIKFDLNTTAGSTDTSIIKLTSITCQLVSDTLMWYSVLQISSTLISNRSGLLLVDKSVELVINKWMESSRFTTAIFLSSNWF